jgi:hypothetical protein
MANQDQSIPEPNPQPSHLSPQSLTPTGWDESAGFRETFLYHYDDPADTGALRHVGRMLHLSVLELARSVPPGGESSTRLELRAVAADLRHAQGFLAAVARHQEESELSLADAELAALAARQAFAIAGLAAVIEQALG